MTDPARETSFAGRTLGDVVHSDGRSAQVFERFGLDFCCGGRRTLREAASAAGVPVEEVVDALAALGDPGAEDLEPAEWTELDALVRHIVERHHAYVRAASPAISAWLERLVDRHGARHPELGEVRETFRELAGELETHMMKEENILFPVINDLARARRGGGRLPLTPFGTILNPVRVMETDHALAGRLLEHLRSLTDGFTPPPDACTTYRLCYTELAQFERDLHRHIHLENNLLFPRALELEQS
jgi:regulator of cell morphogenesis and NO signaling